MTHRAGLSFSCQDRGMAASSSARPDTRSNTRANTRPRAGPASAAASPKPAAKAPSAKPAPKPRRAPAPPPRPYHHGSLRASLLDAADALLADRGEPALTLREVARVAGVSHAAPYHHFPAREDLLAAVAQRAFVQLGDAMHAAAQAGDAREALLGICEAYVRQARARPAHFRLMFGPLLARKAQFPEFAQAAQRSFDVLLHAASRHSPRDGASLALAGWSIAHGFANLAIDGAFDGLPLPGPADETLARALAARVLAPARQPRARG